MHFFTLTSETIFILNKIIFHSAKICQSFNFDPMPPKIVGQLFCKFFENGCISLHFLFLFDSCFQAFFMPHFVCPCAYAFKNFMRAAYYDLQFFMRVFQLSDLWTVPGFFVLTTHMHVCTHLKNFVLLCTWPKKSCAQIFYSIKTHHHS